MTWKAKLREVTDLILDEPTPTRPMSEARTLDSDDFDSFMVAANQRDDPLWNEIDAYMMGELAKRWPVRAYKLRKEIKWLRKQAAGDGLEWGKP